jgi:hypothetical protein
MRGQWENLPVMLAFLGLFAVPSPGQTKRKLPPDDPELYSGFFFFVENFAGWLDARQAAIPASKARLTQSAAAHYLNVDMNELAKVTARCRAVAANLRQIGLEAQQYWQGEVKNHRSPDAATVRQFAARRQAAIQAGINQLKQELSSGSWKGLQTHINNEHRTGLQVVPQSNLNPTKEPQRNSVPRNHLASRGG